MSELHPDYIPEEEVKNALNTWKYFWPMPYALREGTDTEISKWRELFTRGINRSKTARRYWNQAKEQVLATCERFPWPKDVISAAYQIHRGEDIVQQERHQQHKTEESKEEAASVADVERIIYEKLPVLKPETEEPDQ